MKPPLMAALYLSMALVQAQDFARGIGIYPGDPHAYAGPALRLDTTTYRNLALHRPAWHSGSHGCNLTAQLVTDGIRDTKMPRWLAVSTSQHGTLKKNEREWLLDGNWATSLDLKGSSVWVQIEIGDGDAEIDRAVLAWIRRPAAAIVQVSADAKSWTTWKTLGESAGLTDDWKSDQSAPALMVRLKAVRAKSGDRILPALHSDNCIFLMPGERRTVTTIVKEADTRGEAPAIVIENRGR